MEAARTREKAKPEDLVGKPWLSPEEAMVLFPFRRTRLYTMLADGTIPSAQDGRKRFIKRADLDAYLEARMRQG